MNPPNPRAEGATAREAARTPPSKFELWWCETCGEPSLEWCDPCQTCGNPVRKWPMVAEQAPEREREALRAVLNEREAECGAGWQRAVEYEAALTEARTFLRSIASATPQSEQGAWMVETAKKGVERSEPTLCEPDAVRWVRAES